MIRQSKGCVETRVGVIDFIVLFVYKMTQFLGRPQGPLSFAAGSSVSICAVGFGVAFGVAVGPVDASFAGPDPAPFVVAPAAAIAPAPSSFFLEPSLVVPSSQSKLTLLMAFQKSSPCCFAIVISVAEGCLLPSAPAKVPAPHGEPPRASVRAAWYWKVVL